MTEKIGFIGAGKVGFTLGKYFSMNGIALSGYFSRSESSAKEAAAFTCSQYFTETDKLIAESSVIFLTVPDGAINDTYASLHRELLNGKQLCHCSGALSAEEAFPEIAKYGAKGTSVHPLFPISSRTVSYKELGSAFFCIEGDCADEWSRILSDLGNPVRIISSSVKSRYHAACSIASNLVCGLIRESAELLETCGFSEKEALEALRPLAMSNIRRVFEVGPTAALTGPVERNDAATVKKHISCLNGEINTELYRAVSRKLTEMAQERHPESDHTEMTNILRFPR